jgi:hypothetical protein
MIMNQLAHSAGEGTSVDWVDALLADFQPISLLDLEGASLLNRFDTKFLINERQLLRVLTNVHEHYNVLVVENHRIGRYATIYFDTPKLKMYLDHHNGVRDRYKVRIRSYQHNATSFLEIKRKSNKERTEKLRIPTDMVTLNLPDDMAQFISAHTPYQPTELQCTLWNTFGRISLVSKDATERLTLDVGLRFGWDEQEGALPGLVVAEMKQPRFTMRSPFVQEMRRLRVPSTGFSKYCTGVAILRPGAKQNGFKEQLALIRRMLDQRGSQ